eukprot:TRINITY_DN35_c0_g1_i1.p1 TRINITY_DN35_c0_g1~~TRINITY_DN35_c0_g1_i1.p1  ORF type:complete len:786 (+),score=185.26 TRINITY_DN35_c0_g1_i1:1640-3997(+)
MNSLAWLLAVIPMLVEGQQMWTTINCPVTGNSCSYNNDKQVDEAVTLFFQTEQQSGTASISCTVGNAVTCFRSYPLSDTGSAGGCFFVIPAGAQMSCDVQGTVNIIGSHVSPLKGALMDTNTKTIPCNNGDCSYRNTLSNDLWVSQRMVPNGNGINEFNCKYNNMEVCAYAVNGAQGGYSCNFILPSGADLKCRTVSGSFDGSSEGFPFKENVLQLDSQTVPMNCPNVTYPKPDMCDCAYTNNRENDLVVSVVSSSTNEDYNSFHCYYGGANVCSWGSNRNDKGNRGGCYFVLPAGQDFSCAMQWGAASFSVTVAKQLNGSLWASSLESAKAAVPKRAASLEEPIDISKNITEHQELFTEWKLLHKKTYSSKVEEQQRFNNFRKHLNLFYSQGNTGLPNHLADWSKREFETHLRDCAHPNAGADLPPPPADRIITEEDIKNMPESVDWRTKGVVTPVKDQGQCGSCWSFSTTGVTESAWAIAGNKLQSLSEQKLVSCDTGSDGCNGGWPYQAVQWTADNGADTEESYPYVSGNGNVPACHAGSPADVKVTGYYSVNRTEDAMAATVAKYGPISIALDAMTQIWWPYTGGIVSNCCNKQPDHAVLIVGYGIDNGQKYWLIKNSWNANWGENGYIRLERGSDQCGITSAPIQALVQGGVTPPPRPPPSTACPPETTTTVVGDKHTCTWTNNTKGLKLPPASSQLQEYCDYFSKGGYFGYSWSVASASHFDYPCPPHSRYGTSSGNTGFCTFQNGSDPTTGVYVPTGGTVDCSQLAQGTFSYSFTASK